MRARRRLTGIFGDRLRMIGETTEKALQGMLLSYVYKLDKQTHTPSLLEHLEQTWATLHSAGPTVSTHTVNYPDATPQGPAQELPWKRHNQHPGQANIILSAVWCRIIFIPVVAGRFFIRHPDSSLVIQQS